MGSRRADGDGPALGAPSKGASTALGDGLSASHSAHPRRIHPPLRLAHRSARALRMDPRLIRLVRHQQADRVGSQPVSDALQ